jgi:hypothetical protein
VGYCRSQAKLLAARPFSSRAPLLLGLDRQVGHESVQWLLVYRNEVDSERQYRNQFWPCLPAAIRHGEMASVSATATHARAGRFGAPTGGKQLHGSSRPMDVWFGVSVAGAAGPAACFDAA